MVLAQVEKVFNVRVPRLNVDGECSLALPASLIDIPGRHVEDAEHWDEPVARPSAAANVRAARADLGNRDANPARVLRDAGAATQGLVYAVDGIVLDVQEEARAHLWQRRSRIVHCGRSVDEQPFRHHLVRLERTIDVVLAVDAQCDPHQHVLGTLVHRVVLLQQVRPLQRLEAEIIVRFKVTVVHDRRVDLVAMRLRNAIQLLRNDWRVLPVQVHVIVQGVHHFGECLGCLLMHVRDRDPSRQVRKVGVVRAHVRRGLCRKLIDFDRGHAIVQARDDLLRHKRRVDDGRIKPITKFLDSCSNLVKHDRHTATVALHNLHRLP